MTVTLEPARDQLEIFIEGLFRHADQRGIVSLRAFYENDAKKPFRITPTALTDGLKFLMDAAMDDARRAAQAPKAIVFCPPIACFTTKDQAREKDLFEGFALSVECDARPHEARPVLETLLGPATFVVRSGGSWTAPDGAAHDKLHLHWRLAQPARGAALTKLKTARDLAARLVGGDPSNKPVCHPIRWPGSWHRKAEPRLCAIEAMEPDRELELEHALIILTEAEKAAFANARPNGAGASGGPAAAEEGRDWADLLARVAAGQDLHDSIKSLAMMLLRARHADASAVRLLRALMVQSAAARDARWQARYDDIPRAVRSARETLDAEQADANLSPPDEPPPAPNASARRPARRPIRRSPTSARWLRSAPNSAPSPMRSPGSCARAACTRSPAARAKARPRCW
jgi:hypothetical protein